MKIRFEPEATAELEDAALWYDSQHPALGTRFLAAVDAALTHVGQWPEAAPLVPSMPTAVAVRRVTVRQFPYRIAYLVLEDTIRVLAVAHTRRAPGYWHDRRRLAAEPRGTDQ